MRRLVLLWFAVSSWGCSADDDSFSASELWCHALCSAAHRCDGNRDVSSCSSDCVSQRSQLNDISVQGAAPLSDCLEAMNCKDLFDQGEQWKAAYDGCWQQAKSKTEVTPSVRAFCESYTLAEFNCGYWYATDACERDFSMWSESVRGRVTACTLKSECSEADTCISAIFENR